MVGATLQQPFNHATALRDLEHIVGTLDQQPTDPARLDELVTIDQALLARLIRHGPAEEADPVLTMPVWLRVQLRFATREGTAPHPMTRCPRYAAPTGAGPLAESQVDVPQGRTGRSASRLRAPGS